MIVGLDDDGIVGTSVFMRGYIQYVFRMFASPELPSSSAEVTR